ncbi:Rab geranylgeranyl transferase beta prenyltransferase alpha alpha toroid fold [Cryptosporidium sp. chipmunk genotype I]|uniref:Rab geranylgeranyl transferase beta prenyltransferase alpha alpha toroid fold n=1 Tax=Cryptosporidium sp. chipmunk genotype I TaxID=1280935 RepID=UPI00351A335D|nr:Rab geranylgeranyl transferase beta prenyltransferase alpha alpha toroid fold [Cryptosporidium sp. chipmunk genotype I]
MQSLSTKKLNPQKHYEFLLDLYFNRDTVSGLLSHPMKMSGLFWGIGSMKLLFNDLQSNNKDQIKELEARIFDFVESCKVFVDGDMTMVGYSQNKGLNANIVSTHYALLILMMIDKLDRVDSDKISKWISSLQNEDGSFRCDRYLETDCRFSYCALSSLTIINRINEIDIAGAQSYILRCYNSDGAFGGVPCSESHAAYTYCCVVSLAFLNSLDIINIDKLSFWLCERQLLCGGFNGRPEKAPDVCYSWWIFSLLYFLGRANYIDRNLLERYIFCSEDTSQGGFSDRPGNLPDVFHTFFGISALSLIRSGTIVNTISPIFAVPVNLVSSDS